MEGPFVFNIPSTIDINGLKITVNRERPDDEITFVAVCVMSKMG